MIPTLYIPISDSTNWLVEIYCYLFNKYWGKEHKVVFLGFSIPEIKLPENISFISLDKQQFGGANSWSKYLLSFFENLEDEHLILSLEDFFPVSVPDLSVVSSITALMSKDISIGRFDLTWDTFANCRSKIVGTLNDSIAVIEPDNVIYRISCQPAVWKRSYLVDILRHTTSPWDFEINGSVISTKLNHRVLALADPTFKKFPTKWVAKGAVSRHHPDKINVLGLTVETIKELVSIFSLDETKLQWGQWQGYVPSFHELGGYDFRLDRMPHHPASPSNWLEWKETYKS